MVRQPRTPRRGTAVELDSVLTSSMRAILRRLWQRVRPASKTEAASLRKRGKWPIAGRAVDVRRTRD